MQTIQRRPDRLAEQFQQGFYDDIQALKSASESGARRAHRSVTDAISKAWSPVKAFMAWLMPYLMIAVCYPLTLLAEVTAAFLVLIGGVYGVCLMVIAVSGSIVAFGAVLEFLHLI